mmetsp:Transcript_21651/g.66569  ORF Transcript_21651/g.66569 Transcript_21651/m.66569 type:complete len:280 (-) Transcript_21651:27-866(-)
MRDGVPEKHVSTTSGWRPSASKICAPLYDWSVEMPILDMTLSNPLASALRYALRSSASSGASSSAGPARPATASIHASTASPCILAAKTGSRSNDPAASRNAALSTDSASTSGGSAGARDSGTGGLAALRRSSLSWTRAATSPRRGGGVLGLTGGVGLATGGGGALAGGFVSSFWRAAASASALAIASISSSVRPTVRPSLRETASRGPKRTFADELACARSGRRQRSDAPPKSSRRRGLRLVARGQRSAPNCRQNVAERWSGRGARKKNASSPARGPA